MNYSKFKKALIIPYFGKFNNYFKFWLISCSYNEDYDFLIFTDDHTKYNFPQNVKVSYLSFCEMHNKIQSLFDFKISLKSPYKLCDYKPAYGHIFMDDLRGYDFWGYCDTDLIFGHLSDFYTDEILAEYDKISDAGHFTLFRNNVSMRYAYKTLSSYKCYDYKSVFSNEKNFAFDEWGYNKGINRLLLENKLSIYYKPIWFSDIRINSFGLYNTRAEYDLTERAKLERAKKNIVFSFSEGYLVQYSIVNGRVERNEEAYVHLQKRPMKINAIHNESSFLICPPNRFVDFEEIDYSFLKKINTNRIYWHYIKIRFNNLKRKIKNFLKIKVKK